MFTAKEAARLADCVVGDKDAFARLQDYVFGELRIFAESGNRGIDISMAQAMNESDSALLAQFGPERMLSRILSEAGFNVEIIRPKYLYPESAPKQSGPLDMAPTLRVYWGTKSDDKEGEVIESVCYN